MKASLRLAVVTSVALTAAGCTTNKLAADLRSDQAPSRSGHFNDKSSLVQCLTERERPVLTKEKPATLDLFDGFAAQRAELAGRYDSGALEKRQYETGLDWLESLTRAQLTERRQRSAPE
jgi:hypothetical protein